MAISKKILITLGLSLSALSFTSHAVDFKSADDLFALRNTGESSAEKFENASKAREAYAEIFNQSSGDDRLYAFTQMGRLDLFRGVMIPDLDKSLLSKRVAALESCISVSQKETRGSSRQEHHYFYIACLGALGKISPFEERAKLAFKLKMEESTALETTKVGDRYVGGFEGGGILRIFAGIYVNKKAILLRLYNPKQGLAFARVALESAPQANKPFAEMSGKDYFDNFYYEAQGLTAVGMQEKNRDLVMEAKNKLIKTVDTITELNEAGELPAGREPEILHYQKVMKEFSETLTKCLAESDWNKCLDTNLDE